MIDILVLLFMAVMFLSGFGRGIMRQLWALAVLALATYIAGNLFTSFTGLAGRYIHDENASALVCFGIVFGIVSAIASGPMDVWVFRGRRRRAGNEAIPERLAGGVLGILEAIGSTEVGALLLLTFPIFGWDGWIKSSSIIAQLLRQIPIMLPLLPSQFEQAARLLG